MCPAGFYSDVGAYSCIMCEQDYACPTPYASDKFSCTSGTDYATGFYSYPGSVACYPVPPHMSYDYSVGARLETCDWGHVSATAANNCLVCDEHYQCPSDNIAPELCEAAQDRFVSQEGETICNKKQMTYKNDDSGTNSDIDIVRQINGGYFG